MINRFIGTVGLILVGAALAQAAEMHAVVRDHKGRLVADAVVLAVPLDPHGALRARPPKDAVDQVDKQFVPYVKAIFVGSTVRFPNSDNIRHQVYSFSPAKKFEVPLYGGTSAPPVIFDKPGVVVLGCNIHDWMVGYVYVSESPFFAKTGQDGKGALTDLPLPAYVVRVWHPELEVSEEATLNSIHVSRDRRI